VNPTAGLGISISATCGTGTLVGGGGRATVVTSVPGHVVYLGESYPSSTTTWIVTGRVGAQNLTGGETMAVTAYAVCAS
jgi:hypothetical protein